MLADEYIELFFSQSYEKEVDKLIRDDKDFVIPYERLFNYVETITAIPYQKYINYIIHHPLNENVETKDITQSSSFSACEIEMCNALLFVDNPGLNYLEIGKLFPEYVSRPNDIAFRKYGENQIKTSAHLGLAYEYYKYWYLSCLGYIYPRLTEKIRNKLLARTILRTPLYNRMMVDLCFKNIETTKYMGKLSHATQLRREGSVYRLLKICLNECYQEDVKLKKLFRFGVESHLHVIYKCSGLTMDEVAESCKEKKAYNSLIKTSIQTNSHDIRHYESDEHSSSFRRYSQELSKYGTFSNEETKILFERYKDGDKKAYEQIVKGHLKLVVNIARLYRHRGVSFEDMIQEGNIGLLKAISLFDHTLNTSFIEYAKSCIFQAISQSALILPHMLTIPLNVVHRHFKLHRYLDRLEQHNGFEPPISEEECESLLGTKDITKYLLLPYDLLTINVYDDCDLYEGSFPPTDEPLMKESLQIYVNTLLNQLDKRQREIVKQYYGIGCPEKNLETIGKQQNLTRERVRQILWHSIHDLREFIEKNKKRANQEKDCEEVKMPKDLREVKKNGFFSYVNEKVNLLQENKEKKKEWNLLSLQARIDLVLSRHNVDGIERQIKKQPISQEGKDVKNIRSLSFYSERSLNTANTIKRRNEIHQDKVRNTKGPEHTSSTKVLPFNHFSSEFSSYTSLQQLVKKGLLTKKECKHCNHKGLHTIGDVQRMIQKYHLTRNSTRFTQYTLDIWFKIIDVL